MINYLAEGQDIIVSGLSDISLQDTLDCGQCFRFSKIDEELFEGVAGEHYLKVGKQGDIVRFYNTTEELFCSFWKRYFDMDTDYLSIRTSLSQDEVLAKAIKYAPGIRVLKQDPWETLLSFILSQNNNVKRIKGIVERLAAEFGEPIADGFYAFPTVERMANCTLEDLVPLRAGFRAKYIMDAIQKVASGELDLQKVAMLPTAEAQKSLITIKGVGEKVADCVLLYGFGRMECFPKDVWIKRAVKHLYPQGLPQVLLENGGIAQQYIFHYARTCPEAFVMTED
ncbi:MAG: DNA glycosylase [Oscillospiraceae bacterium]